MVPIVLFQSISLPYSIPAAIVFLGISLGLVSLLTIKILEKHPWLRWDSLLNTSSEPCLDAPNGRARSHFGWIEPETEHLTVGFHTLSTDGLSRFLLRLNKAHPLNSAHHFWRRFGELVPTVGDTGRVSVIGSETGFLLGWLIACFPVLVFYSFSTVTF